MDPRLSLTRIHVRTGRRVVSIWWIVPGLVAFCVALVVAFKIFVGTAAGSPLRLRVENQLGFKQVKWIEEIELVHDFRERGAGQGGYNEDHEFYGYRDEI